MLKQVVYRFNAKPENDQVKLDMDDEKFEVLPILRTKIWPS